jgi:hypothetical protein
VPEPVRDDLARARGTTGSGRHRRSVGAPGSVGTVPEATAIVRERVVRSGTTVAGCGRRVTNATEVRAVRVRVRGGRAGSPTEVRAWPSRDVRRTALR